MNGIIGKKLGMTRVIKDDGRVIPITVIQCDPNEVTQVKTEEKDGYPAVVLGFSELKKPRKTRKFMHLKEFQAEDGEEVKKGDKVTLETFKEVEEVRVTGISKGKGFQGVIKRYNFSRGPESHGSHHHREPGSIGACAKPGRVLKGKKMPGRMGTDTVTIKRTKVEYIDIEKNLIGLRGPVPGGKNGIIIIKKNA
ncbi:MAG: 50S ribosomal protein L3 [Patescibacteria group bacterium]|nr:50S ribosomal protein L3 [Patescibacteria group bacterium]